MCTAVLLTPVYVKEMWTSLYHFVPLEISASQAVVT
jgi:hypothetical protein